MSELSTKQFGEMGDEHKISWSWRHWGHKAQCSTHGGVGTGQDRGWAHATMQESCARLAEARDAAK